jgi:cyclic pyranopterin monophosphate synthase
MTVRSRLSHIDEQGNARMVNVTAKSVTQRNAVARATVHTSNESATALPDDIVLCAKLAGLHAAKQTSLLIPLCHPIPLDNIDIDIVDQTIGEINTHDHTIGIEAGVDATWKTGVEMEALTAVTIAALTLVCELRRSDPLVRVEDIAVWKKRGGKSGDWGRAV